jgi:hypothetical protein
LLDCRIYGVARTNNEHCSECGAVCANTKTLRHCWRREMWPVHRDSQTSGCERQSSWWRDSKCMDSGSCNIHLNVRFPRCGNVTKVLVDEIWCIIKVGIDFKQCFLSDHNCWQCKKHQTSFTSLHLGICKTSRSRRPWSIPTQLCARARKERRGSLLTCKKNATPSRMGWINTLA